MADDTISCNLDFPRSIINHPLGKTRGPPSSIFNQSMSFTQVGPPPLAHFHPPAIFYGHNLPNLNPPVPLFYRSHCWNPNNNNLTNSNYRPYSPAHRPPFLSEAFASLSSWNSYQSQFQPEYSEFPYFPGVMNIGDSSSYALDLSRNREDHRLWNHHATSGFGCGHMTYSNSCPSGVFMQNQGRSSPVLIQQLNDQNQNDGEMNLDRIFPIITIPDSSSINMGGKEPDDFKIVSGGRMFQSLAPRFSEEELLVDVETVPGQAEFPQDMTMATLRNAELEESLQPVAMDYDSDFSAGVEAASRSAGASRRSAATATKIQAYDATQNGFKRKLSQEMDTEAGESHATSKPMRKFKLLKRN